MKKFWIAFAIGALAGGVAALLYAPQSGPSTRKKLKQGLEDLGDSLSDAADYVKEQAERLSKEAQRLLESSKEQVSEAVTAAVGSAQEYAKATASKAEDVTSRLM